jgi:hypothetical protein
VAQDLLATVQAVILIQQDRAPQVQIMVLVGGHLQPTLWAVRQRPVLLVQVLVLVDLVAREVVAQSLEVVVVDIQVVVEDTQLQVHWQILEVAVDRGLMAMPLLLERIQALTTDLEHLMV